MIDEMVLKFSQIC